MIDLPKHKMTADEFLAWAERLPREAGKFELWDGDVVVTHGPAGFESAERSEHWEAKGAMYRAAARRHQTRRPRLLRLRRWRQCPPLQQQAGPAGRAGLCGRKVARGVLEVPDPLILVEVLSPSTRSMDMGRKLQGYFALPSLAHYLVIDPDLSLAIHHRRGTADATETRIASDPRLELDPPGLDVDLTEVLAGP